jgi:hypothetical protein
VALELPDMSFSQSEEWSWNDVLGEINEVADRVCQEVEESEWFSVLLVKPISSLHTNGFQRSGFE